MKKFKLFLAVILLINIFVVIFTLSACKPKDDGDNNKIITPPPIDDIVEPYKFVGSDYYAKNNNPHITDYFDDEIFL